MTSSRDDIMNCPRKTVRYQQGQAVVTRDARDGKSLTSVLVANGTHQSARFTVPKYISKTCLTCPKFIVHKTFISNVTKKSILLLITLGKNFHVTLVT